MKSYSYFVTEAYSAKSELQEKFGVFGKAARFIPGLQTAYGLGLGTYRLAKGDVPGAALGYAQAIPGPIGWTATAADIGRELAGGGQQQVAKPEEKPKQKPAPAKPAPASPSTPAPAKPSDNTLADKVKSQIVLAKKDGVEGRLDKATGKFTAGEFSAAEKQRYQTSRGAEQLAKDVEKVKATEPRDYVDQKIKPLELKKPVTLTPMKPTKITIPKISA